ncbi:MAG: DUF6484 domain-containing protein [Vicinamibacterales bacterium]
MVEGQTMKVLHQAEEHVVSDEPEDDGPLRPLIIGRQSGPTEVRPGDGGIVIGELLALSGDGRTPLVMYPGQSGPSPIPARSVVDVHAPHIGKQVVLMFEGEDRARPIIMGILRDGHSSSIHPSTGNVEVESDGERLIVTAKAQLVLRCGKASITLTNAGKVLIEGAYVSSRSTGVNRVHGGSVQLN